MIGEDEEQVSYFRSIGMLRYPNELSNDLYLLNSLERCYSSDIKYPNTAEFIVANILNQDKIPQHQNVMVNMIPYMLN